MAHPVSLLAALAGLDAPAADAGEALDADLLAELALLDHGQRRVVHALAGALLQNRAE